MYLVTMSIGCGSASTKDKEDTRFATVDVLTERELLLDNGVPLAYIESTAASITWTLAARSEVHWDGNCTVKRQDVWDVQNKMTPITTCQLIAMIVIIVVTTFSGIVVPLSELIACKLIFFWKPQKLNKKHLLFFKRGVRFNALLNIVSKACKLVPIIVSISFANILYAQCARYVAADCTTDTVAKTTLENLTSELESDTSVLNKVLLVIDGALLGLFCLLFLWSCLCLIHKKRLRSK